MKQEALRFFEDESGVKALFSTMDHGNMKGHWGGAPGNRFRFVEEHFPGLGRFLVLPNVQHENRVYPVRNDIYFTNPNCDAVVTSLPQLPIAVTGADCFPVFFYDRINGVIAVAHCSSKSVMLGIILRTVSEMMFLGADNICAEIGPGIGSCCYEYDEGRAFKEFRGYEDHIHERDGRTFVDLAGIIWRKLSDAGVSRICANNICTFCHRGEDGEADLFSYRRMGQPDPVLAGIGVFMLLE